MANQTTAMAVQDQRGERGWRERSHLVFQTPYIFVEVVKAKELPTKEDSTESDYLVEVKLHNTTLKTKPIKNTSSSWNTILPFIENSAAPPAAAAAAAASAAASHTFEITVKDKDTVLGKVIHGSESLPLRKRGEPLAPRWYPLTKSDGGDPAKGHLMLSMWKGTQEDEDYIAETNPNRRSKIYIQPLLFYLRVHVYHSQYVIKDLAPGCRLSVGLSVPSMAATTYPLDTDALLRRPVPEGAAPAADGAGVACWDQECLLVVADGDESLLVTLAQSSGGSTSGEDKQRKELLSRRVDLFAAPVRTTAGKFAGAAPFWLRKEKEETTGVFLSVVKEGGHHFLEEEMGTESDHTPSDARLRPPEIAQLELGFLDASVTAGVSKDGKLEQTDVYCVAKYGRKWARSGCCEGAEPRWQQQFRWPVFDHCTVITVAVFDRAKQTEKKTKDSGKGSVLGTVRIRLSTLKFGKVYEPFYDLWVLRPGQTEAKRTGRLHLSLRLTRTVPISRILSLYMRPLLPKNNYYFPISPAAVSCARTVGRGMIAAALAAKDPPLHVEVVEAVLPAEAACWSYRRTRSAYARALTSTAPFSSMAWRFWYGTRRWRSKGESATVFLVMMALVVSPETAMPVAAMTVVAAAGWNGWAGRGRRAPFQMDVALSQAGAAAMAGFALDEEFDEPATVRAADVVKARYERLRALAWKMETVTNWAAIQAERIEGLLGWRDPRASGVFLGLCVVAAAVTVVVPARAVVGALLCFIFIPGRGPFAPSAFFQRLPPLTEVLL